MTIWELITQIVLAFRPVCTRPEPFAWLVVGHNILGKIKILISASVEIFFVKNFYYNLCETNY